MQLVSMDTVVLSKKFDIFYPENMKKLPSKVVHNQHATFFMYWPGCPNGPETESCTTKSPLMQDWVSRLGSGLLWVSLFVKLSKCARSESRLSLTTKCEFGR